MAFSFQPKTVTGGLVLYLDAANVKSYPGSGTTWTDLSPTTITGSLTNGPTFSSTRNGEIVFDGSNDYIDLGSNSNLQFSSGAFSIVVWFLSTNVSSPQILVSHGDSAYALYINTSKLWFSKPLIANDASGPSISSNTWYQVVLINNIGSNTNYYLNGVFQTTKTFTSTPSYSKNFRVGATDSEGYYLNGRIGSVSLYNRALSATEVLQNYNALKGRFGLT